MQQRLLKKFIEDFLTIHTSAMFAVPGWAVSPDSLVPAAAKDVSAPSASADVAISKSQPKSKKRKRDEPGLPTEPRVSSEDLQRLWSREFGDGGSGKQKSSRAKSKKGQQEQSNVKPQAAHNAVLEKSTKNGGKANHKSKLGTTDSSKAGTLQTAQKSRTEKQGKGANSRNGVDTTGEKIDNKESTGVALKTGDEKIKGSSDQHSQKGKAEQALQKFQEMPLPAVAKLTPLQAKMRDKLTSARFRHLNETLYTSPSSASLDLFTASPNLFAEYHAGFAQQVKESWPENPVDSYIRDIKARGRPDIKAANQDFAVKTLPLPRRKTGSCTIADLGCGDAPLAHAFQSKSKALNLKFHNFDLHTPNSFVTKADIANLPLRDGEADIAVFCLSLMGTNWISFVEEAWRVLRGDGKGELWVAEVKSRFGRAKRGAVVENSVGKKRKLEKPKAKQGKTEWLAEEDPEVFAENEGIEAQDETDISAFVDVVQRRGFALQPESVNKRNKMFVNMIFHKVGVPSVGKHQGLKWNGREYEKATGSATGRKQFVDNGGDDDYPSLEEEAKVLKPCVYKKR